MDHEIEIKLTWWVYNLHKNMIKRRNFPQDTGFARRDINMSSFIRKLEHENHKFTIKKNQVA
jgi:hypothetical protein